MRTIYLFFSLLLSLTAFGQPSPINRRAFALAGLATTSKLFPANLGYYWVYVDMPTNILVTNWVDRIQGSVWTNGAADTTRPTNSDLGVHFDSTKTQILTNYTISFYGTNSSSHWIIIRRDKNNAFQDFLDYANSGDLEWGYYNDNTHAVSAGVAARNDGPSLLGDFQDLAWVSDGAANNTSFYTNGVFATNWSGTVINSGKTWRIMGGIANEGYFGGYIKAFGIWSNTVFTVNQVSNLHYAFTNGTYTNTVIP